MIKSHWVIYTIMASDCSKAHLPVQLIQQPIFTNRDINFLFFLSLGSSSACMFTLPRYNYNTRTITGIKFVISPVQVRYVLQNVYERGLMSEAGVVSHALCCMPVQLQTSNTPTWQYKDCHNNSPTISATMIYQPANQTGLLYLSLMNW